MTPKITTPTESVELPDAFPRVISFIEFVAKDPPDACCSFHGMSLYPFPERDILESHVQKPWEEEEVSLGKGL